MSERNWRVFAFVGVGSLLFSLGTVAVGTFDLYRTEHRIAADKAVETDAAQARQERQFKCIGIAPAMIPECQVNAEKAADYAREPNYDLKAQQDMAAWAYGTMWTTIIGAIITAIGVAYVALTLHEARISAKAALDAARAGWEAAKIAKGQSIAYLHVARLYVPGRVSSDVSDLLSNAIKSNSAPIRLKLVNMGQTLAKRVQILIEIDAFERDGGTIKYRELIDPFPRIVANIAPNQDPDVIALPSLPYELRRLVEAGAGQQSLIIVRGEVRYSDVLDDDYRTAFMYTFPFVSPESLPANRDLDFFELPAETLPVYEKITRKAPQP